MATVLLLALAVQTEFERGGDGEGKAQRTRRRRKKRREKKRKKEGKEEGEEEEEEEGREGRRRRRRRRKRREKTRKKKKEEGNGEEEEEEGGRGRRRRRRRKRRREKKRKKKKKKKEEEGRDKIFESGAYFARGSCIASGSASGSVTKDIATAAFQTAQNHSFQGPDSDTPYFFTACDILNRTKITVSSDLVHHTFAQPVTFSTGLNHSLE